MKPKLLSLLKFTLGWPLSLLALFFLLKIITPQTPILLTNLQNTNLPLLLSGTFCFVIFYYLRAYIWHRLLKGYNYHIPFQQTSNLWATSELKRYIPGNIWSFLGRTVRFTEKGVTKKHMGTLLLIEAEIFVVSCFVVSLLSVPFVFNNLFPGIPEILQAVIYLLAIIGLIAYIYHDKIRQKIPREIQPVMTHLFPQLPSKEIFILLNISLLALVLFGLAHYLIIASITILPPQIIISLIGFVVLSFVLGYLSFLTPAGFGVREGILILGLTTILPLELASFASIFTRLILMVAELIFISTTILITKQQIHTSLSKPNQ